MQHGLLFLTSHDILLKNENQENPGALCISLPAGIKRFLGHSNIIVNFQCRHQEVQSSHNIPNSHPDYRSLYQCTVLTLYSSAKGLDSVFQLSLLPLLHIMLSSTFLHGSPTHFSRITYEVSTTFCEYRCTSNESLHKVLY